MLELNAEVVGLVQSPQDHRDGERQHEQHDLGADGAHGLGDFQASREQHGQPARLRHSATPMTTGAAYSLAK